MIKSSIFIKKSPYELVSLMPIHTDQVDRRGVDKLFQQFRQYDTSLRGQKGAKAGVNWLKQAVFALNSRLICISNQFLHWNCLETVKNKHKNYFWRFIKHGTSIRGQIRPRWGVKYIKNRIFCILFLIHLSFCSLLTGNQCKKKEK